jgi:uncharacterized repeat protein (TIGR01451 family)
LYWDRSTATRLRDVGFRRQTGLSTLVVLVLLVAVALAAPSPAAAYQGAASVAAETGTPAPIACSTPSVFDAAGTPNTQLFAQTQTTTGATFDPVGPPWSGGTYNAMGFDPATRLIYAVSSSGQLLIIDSTGAVTNAGAISGIPAVATIVAGAFDASGGYYIEDADTGNIYRVNLTTRVATFIMTNPFLNLFDFTEAHGYLWGLNTAASGAMLMVRIDLANKVVTSYSLAGLGLPSDRYGAAWTYGNGDLGFDRNAGGVFQIAVTSPGAPTPTFSLVASGAGPGSTNNDGTSCVPGPVDLAIATSGPATALHNGQVTWTLTVTNRGPNVSSGRLVTDTVPAGYAAVASRTAGCVVTGSTVQCRGGVLAVGASATIVLTARAPDAAGCLSNTATVRGNETDPVPANDLGSTRTCVGQKPSLVLATSAVLTTDANRDRMPGVGDRITFRFALRNTGDVVLSGVAVADRLVAPAAPAVSVSCPASTLAPGASMVCTSTAYAVTQADVDAGSVGNTATASGTAPGGTVVTTPRASTLTPTLVAPGLSVHKEVSAITDANHDHLTEVGDTLQWTFALRNTGAVTLNGVTVPVHSELARTDGGGTGSGQTAPPTAASPTTSAPPTTATAAPTTTATAAPTTTSATTTAAASTMTSPPATPTSQSSTPVVRGTTSTAAAVTGSALAFTGAAPWPVVVGALGLLGLGGVALVTRVALASGRSSESAT